MRCFVIGCALMLMAIPGCGSGRVMVTGTVTYDDGTPVESGTVMAEGTTPDGKLVGVQASIRKDGTFSWGGDHEGDGALPGKYKVILMPVVVSDYQASLGITANIDGKYGKYDSSGLSFEVKPGKNHFEIKIEKPKPKAPK